MSPSVKVQVLLVALLLFATAGQAEDSFFEPQSNEVRDSNLQRIHVKHKSGFDGRVRAIRFSLEPESVRPLDGTAGDDKVATADRPESSDRDVGTKASGQDERRTTATPKTTMGRRLLQSHEKRRSSNVTRFSSSLDPEPTRPKRSIDNESLKNELEDLQTDEAKVFRPLFVYRQQVAKRVKLRNDKRAAAAGDRRRRPVQRPSNAPTDYYYYRRPSVPYHYQQYLYDPYDPYYNTVIY